MCMTWPVDSEDRAFSLPCFDPGVKPRYDHPWLHVSHGLPWRCNNGKARRVWLGREMRPIAYQRSSHCRYIVQRSGSRCVIENITEADMAHGPTGKISRLSTAQSF